MTGFTIRLQRCRIGTGGVRRLISIRCSNSVFFVTDNIMMDKAFVWLCIPLMLLTPGLAPLSGGCGITAKVTMRDGNVRTAEEAQTLALDESAVSTVEIWCRNTPPRYTIHHDNEQVYERTSSTPPRYVLERFAVEQQGEYRCNCQSVSGARLNLVGKSLAYGNNLALVRQIVANNVGKLKASSGSNPFLPHAGAC